MRRIRTALLLLFCLLVLVSVSVSAFRMERLRVSGEVVLLELAPVDPLALLLGYYMDLDYALNRKITWALGRFEGSRFPEHAVVRRDESGVAEFVRLDDGSPLAPDELKVFFRVRGDAAYAGASAYFFQEGLAEVYENAAFGEYCVSPDGTMFLTHLRDAALNRLAPVDTVARANP